MDVVCILSEIIVQQLAETDVLSEYYCLDFFTLVRREIVSRLG